MKRVLRILVIIISMVFSGLHGGENPSQTQSSSTSQTTTDVRDVENRSEAPVSSDANTVVGPSQTTTYVRDVPNRSEAPVSSDTTTVLVPSRFPPSSQTSSNTQNVESVASSSVSSDVLKDESTSQSLPEKTCGEALKAEKRSTMASIPVKDGKWMLRRVTPMTDYHIRFGPDNNFCSVIHYGPDCRTVFFTHFLEPDTITLSYNDRTQDILYTYGKTHSKDSHYLVNQEEIGKMERFKTSNESITPVDPIPESVKADLESEYALIAAAPHGGWSILRTCDKKVTRAKVLLPWDYPRNQTTQQILDIYDEEINAKLDELEIERSTLVITPLLILHDIFSRHDYE